MKFLLGMIVGAVIFYNFPEIYDWVVDMFVDSGMRDKAIDALKEVK